MTRLRNHLITVLITSNNHLIRSGLRRTLESQGNMNVLGDVSLENTVAIDTILHQHPKLVIIDLDSHRDDPLAVIRAVQKNSKSSAILALSDLSNHELAAKALLLGASGLVLKVQPERVLLTAIHELCPLHEVKSTLRGDARGQSEPQSRKSFTAFPRVHSVDSEDKAKIERLTSRELDVIRLLALGFKNKAIAKQLSISDITVRHHLTNIFCKLEVSDRQNLLILAHRYGLADIKLKVESA